MNTVRMALVFSVMASVFASTEGSGADIEILALPDRDNAGLVVVSGRIEDGDAAAFRRAMPRGGKMLVGLLGPGGLVNEALDIGAQIRMRGWATSVVAGKGCYSACALIWVSGARRYYRSDAPIGFHAAYMTTEEGKQVETGMGNADIGSYLTHIGLEREAIQFITAAPPDKISVLSLEKAGLLGIDVLPDDDDKKRWNMLRQIDVRVRASLLVVGGGARCPNIRKVKADEVATLFRLPPDGAPNSEYASGRMQRETLKVLDLFDTSDTRAACREATTFLQNSGFGEYVKRSR